MPGNIVSSSFSRGEVTPELGGRVDIASYKTSLATCRNFIVRSYGGAYNRGGGQYLGFALGTGVAGATSRLRRFRFNTTDTYLLEFGVGFMRVIRDDAYVLDTLKPITGVSVGAVTALTIVSHGYSQGDALQLDNTFVGANLLADRWVIVASVLDANTVEINDPITGGAVNLLAATAYVSGGNAGHVYTLATPYTQADLPLMSFVQSADVMTITVADQTEYELTRSGDAAWTLAAPTFAPVVQPPTSLAVTPNTTGATTTSYVVTSISSLTGEESLPCAAVTITNANDTAISNGLTWDAPIGGDPIALYSIYRAINGIYGFIGDTPDSSFTDANFSPDLSTTPPGAANPFAGGNNPATAMYFQQRLIRAGSTANPDTLYGSQTGLFFNMSVSQPQVDSDALTFTLTSREVNQVRHLVPIKQDLICFTAGQEWRITANGAAFAAENLAILPQSAWGCNYIEPSLIGLTILYWRENGLTMRSARYTYLSDAYTGEDVSLLSSHLFTPQSQAIGAANGNIPDPVNIVTLSSGGIACLTYQEEQQVTAWTRWDTLGAYESVEICRPDLAADSLDDTVYTVVNRTINGYPNVRLVEKIHSRRFTDVRDAVFVDASLTYDNPIAITGITFPAGQVLVTAPNHGLTNASIVSISDVIWQPTYDASWNLLAPYQLAGNNQFGITVLNANAFYLTGADPTQVPVFSSTTTALPATPATAVTSWVPYASGGNARACVTTLNALYHLEGMAVSVLADGNAILGLTVKNGSVTLPGLFARGHVGLQYFSDIGTQSLEVPQGSIQGKEARVPFVTVRVVTSRGWLQGQVASDLLEAKNRNYEYVGDPIDLYTGDSISTLASDWEKNGSVFIRQPYPLPLEVLDIIPAVELED